MLSYSSNSCTIVSRPLLAANDRGVLPELDLMFGLTPSHSSSSRTTASSPFSTDCNSTGYGWHTSCSEVTALRCRTTDSWPFSPAYNNGVKPHFSLEFGLGSPCSSSSRITASCPIRVAYHNGVGPNKSLKLGLTRSWPSSSRIIIFCPFPAARESSVWPNSISITSGSPPCLNNNRQLSHVSPTQPVRVGVWAYFVSFKFGSTLFFSNNRINFLCFFRLHGIMPTRSELGPARSTRSRRSRSSEELRSHTSKI
jgi:hypothetical protein